MKTLKFILLLAIGCVGSVNSLAQIEYTQSNYEMSEMLKKRGAEKVAQMNDNISFMADKSKTLENREYYRQKALNLFIGRGEAYEEDGIEKKGVYMETTSLYRKNPTKRLMKDYFSGLVNLKYSKVDIQSTKVNDIQVSNLRKVDDNTYVCTAYFEQLFCGYGGDGRPIYKDRTRKKVKVYILSEETADGQEFIVLLGDVTALETKKL